MCVFSGISRVELGRYIRHIAGACFVSVSFKRAHSSRPFWNFSLISFGRELRPRCCYFGDESRSALKKFVEEFPVEKWDVPFEFKLMNSVLTVIPKKIIVHVLVHEMRHWAQIATLLRLNGTTGEFHDFLFSPARGG